jgi:Mor family transcriptional regulator
MDVSKIIKGVGTVVSAFNPAIGGAVVMAGSLADSFDNVPDENLEQNFIGLGVSAEIIKSIASKDEISEDDKKRLLAVSENLDGMNTLLQKFTKIFK